ncbi:TonB-dependent receptor [Anaerophaga thermohalophila]|uniref:TonB-dependent receptor n=1 Tax=Anaerophaga thermohalophila TaxID=177400 RepID=UPI0002DA18E2|nr:TonB-dependent receptor [Anaerophaga thermohalophila]
MKKICQWRRNFAGFLPRKVLLAMRLSLGLFLLVSFQTIASVTYSQDTKVTVKMNHAQVKEVLKEIERSSEFYFVYNNELIDVERVVNVEARNQKIKDILDVLFSDEGVSYVVMGRQIVLSPVELMAENIDQPQAKTVRGTVTDKSGEPIPGVTVTVKGTTRGTITDVDGNFSLSVPEDADVLVFSFVGMRTQEVSIGDNMRFDVVMQEDVMGLDEVVVIGYGEMQKSDLTGSVASVKVEDMVESRSSANFESMLQGKVAGMKIVNNGNDNPAGGSTVRIRGLSSINGSNSPLVVVDGIVVGEAGALRNINPSMIESIEVLKDASSTAIYGSRGANGVIIVTTKQGGKGQSHIYVDHKTTLGYFSDELDYWRDPVEMMELDNEAYINAEIEPIYIGQRDPVNGVYYPSVSEVESGAWPYHTTWKDFIFRKPSMTNETSIGVGGGSENDSYYLNATYYDGEGMRIGDDYDKITIDLNYTTQVTDFLSIKTRAGFFKDDRNNVAPGGYQRNPLFPVYRGDGTPFKLHPTDYGNPVAIRENVTNETESVSGYATMQIDVDFTSSLNMILRGNVRASYPENHLFNPVKWTEEGDKWNNRAAHNRSSSKNMQFDGLLTYDETFAQNHNFKAMAGANFDRTTNKSLYGAGSDFPSTTLEDENLAAARVMETGNGFNEETLLSGFGRLNYNYQSKYYATFTARADGSSKFGENNKWGFFPSGALSWRLSEEDFIKNLDFFSYLKLRVSYGVSGNQGIAPYQTNTVYGWLWHAYQGRDIKAYGPGFQIGREGYGDRYITWGGIGNENLKWEKTAQWNLGLDMGIFDNRLNLTMDVYKKNTTDLLREQFLAPNTGFDRIWTNSGEIENRGLEISLNGRIIDSSVFTLNSGVIFSMNRNEVLNLGDPNASGLIEDPNGIVYEPYRGMRGGTFLESYYGILAIGEPMGVFYGYEVDGIIQEMPENPTDLTQPGEFNYVGLNENGTLNPDKRTIIGDPNPDFTGSFNLSLSHRSGFDFSMEWYAVYGNDIISRTKLARTDLQKERWTWDNPSESRPSLRADRPYYFSDWFVEDGSFLRLQNVTLGYNLPPVSFMESARVYVSGSNLVTITNSTQYDPEIAEDGLGDAGYPRVATVSMGVQLEF